MQPFIDVFFISPFNSCPVTNSYAYYRRHAYEWNSTPYKATTWTPQKTTGWDHVIVHDRMWSRKESYSTNGTNPPKDNYTLDRGEEQEENVMAAGCANLQQSQWVMLRRLAALSFTSYRKEHNEPINSQPFVFTSVISHTLHHCLVRFIHRSSHSPTWDVFTRLSCFEMK